MLRRLLLYLFAVGVFLLPASPLHARERVQGWCEQGGNTLAVVGILTTDKAQKSFPGCTVTVWATGTVNLSTIYSDDSGTIKANPFTADGTTGLWSFYADNARYDVQLSGGGLVAPFTLSDFLLDDTAQAVTTISAVSFSATPVFDVGKASILTITLTGNVTSSTITNAVTGQRITIYIAQDGTGGWTFVWPADVQRRKGGYTIAENANAVSVIDLYYDGVNWRETGRDADEETLVVRTTTTAFSATPTFDSAANIYFSITLAGDVTSSTISNASDGRLAYFNICQDATGGRTFAWPASVLTPPTVGVKASTCTSASFIYDGTNWRELAPSSRGSADFDVLTARKLNSSVLNVREFGAAGDGSMDDTVAIQTAIDDTAGATVFFPCGTYRIKNLIQRNDVSLVGAGQCSVLKLPDSVVNSDRLIIVGGDDTCTGCVVRYLVLDGNQDTHGFSDVQMHNIDIRSGTTDFTVFRVSFRDTGGDGVKMSTDGSASPDTPIGIRILASNFAEHERQDIAVVQAENVTISNNVGDGKLDIEPNSPITQLTLTGNIFARMGISNADAAFATRADFTITGNITTASDPSTSPMVVFDIRGATITGNTFPYVRISQSADVVFSGNLVRTLDIWPTGSTTVFGLVATDNLISHITEGADSPPQSGVGTIAYALMIWRCVDCIIASNEIFTEEGGINLRVGASEVTIENNRVKFVEPSPPLSTNPKGIEVTTGGGGSPNIVIVRNTIDGFDQAVDVDGSGSIQGARIEGNISINSETVGGVWDFDFSSTFQNGFVNDNVIVGDINGMIFGATTGTTQVYRNFFLNTTSSDTSIRASGAGTVKIGWNREAVARTAPLTFANGTFVDDENSQGIISFSSTDTTPSVLGGRTFKTANASGTTISDFDNGTTGASIWLIINDANTTIADNANINLTGGANKKYASGDVLQFVLDGTVWNEVPLQSEWTARRFKATGTTLVAGDFALSGGWGTTASVGTIKGNDQWARFTITSAGTGQGANPTATLTFQDGTWTNAPVAVCQRADRANQAGVHFTWTTTATALVLTFRGTPTAAETFVVACHVGGV